MIGMNETSRLFSQSPRGHGTLCADYSDRSLIDSEAWPKSSRDGSGGCLPKAVINTRDMKSTCVGKDLARPTSSRFSVRAAIYRALASRSVASLST